ncbi:myosin regulatory light chain 2, skeletal muscle isoform X1 [Salmo trutta]|uniref:myosin regulatory light chain 2, skeletal muscle isoform X1 n=1 Tax=Salmo trutta TaxID=8032 RepID=UPI0011306819|nr:sesquipedalian-1-like isoform X1 [Salmo trutta]XP_029569041.1 sesquipedalian-1-like isoform X1 [Salmo trutta]XP_029569049.1 sesquipedalian-1-like isoform X1 [Salmo trutta]
MKITGKILTHFQSCSSPVDKEGYLYKKGERNTSYQKRWFMLKANLLFYKDRPNHRDLLGVIVLEGCSVQLCESEEQFAFSLVWSGEPGLRTYKLAAEDQPSQESWIRALLSANHGYLAALVMDLEKQYKEAMKTFPGDPSQQSTLAGPNTERPTQSLIWLNSGTATLSQYLGPSVGAEHSFSTNQMLQVPPISSKPTNKRSPKLWPKRNANVVPINVPAPPQGEWSMTGSGPKVEFSELHEDFGKEVKELIADWLTRGQKDVIQEEDLIDFG